MSTKTIIATVMAALVLTVSSQAQTNAPVPSPTVPAMGNAFTDALAMLTQGSSWAFVGLYGRSTANFANSKGINLVSGDLLYSFSPGQSNVLETGLIIGYDYLWTRGAGEANAIKGGLSLGIPMRPFSWVGSTMLTNITGEPFVGDCLATPQGASSIGNIVLYGLDIQAKKFGGQYSWDLGVGGETRSGQGQFDGNYIWLHTAITRNGLFNEPYTPSTAHRDNSDYWDRL